MESRISVIETKLGEIKEDLAELKIDNKELIKSISRLSIVDNKFKDNDEAHALMWEHIRNSEVFMAEVKIAIEGHKFQLQDVLENKKNAKQILMGIVILGIAAITGWLLYLYKVV